MHIGWKVQWKKCKTRNSLLWETEFNWSSFLNFFSVLRSIIFVLGKYQQNINSIAHFLKFTYNWFVFFSAMKVRVWVLTLRGNASSFPLFALIFMYQMFNMYEQFTISTEFKILWMMMNSFKNRPNFLTWRHQLRKISLKQQIDMNMNANI